MNELACASTENPLASLLALWCDGLARHQIRAPHDSARDGGLWCPDCGFIHGRCGDALYPFLKMARQSGEQKWIDAAIAVQKWSDNRAQDDGSYVNDIGNPWTGITVFAALSLGEALHFHGELLPDAARARWTERLKRAARWIAGENWAAHNNINYPISAAAALASAWRVTGDEHFLTAARRWAHWSRDSFLADGLLFGEGGRAPTRRGIYAVDALYNLEESLPNLALYASITGDEIARDLVLKSFAAHLDFILPDGSYDAGWGSRSFKWTLWGSRTSDGIAGLLPLADFDPRIAESVRRNVQYLRSCTHHGLLYGGPHLLNQGRQACIHHTFSHAKSLACALDTSELSGEKSVLPCDQPRGVWTRAAIGTTFVSLGDWRASFTVSDVFYGEPNWRASGGSPTMIWHAATGPLCVASANGYPLIENLNMAPLRSEREISTLTPRIERGEFCSALDQNARLETLEDGVRVGGRLTNLAGETADEFTCETRFDGDAIHFYATGKNANFVLPVVSPQAETVEWQARRVEIRKPGARVVVESDAELCGDSSRIFHFVPGVQALALRAKIPDDGIRLSIQIQNRIIGSARF